MSGASEVTETNPSLPEFLLARLSEDRDMWRLAEVAELAFTTRSAGIAAVPPENFAKRMVADVEAKRRIVDLHQVDAHKFCRECKKPWHLAIPGFLGPEVGCPTLRALAQPYAAHPEFRGEWAL